MLKFLVKTKYANIINFAANEEIIPELLQSNCNSKNIFKHVSNFLEDPNKIKEQVNKVQKIFSREYKPYTIGKILSGKNKVKLNGKIDWS